jgi:NAD(P)-dependent dehydrogenase (short-subunit alcohol dehydrogenase family)
MSCGRDRSAVDPAAPGRFVECDVADEAQVRALVEQCARTLGPPVALVNNAGVNACFDAVELSEREWDDFFAIDLKASWLCAKHVLPHMLEAGGGAIVNVSSIHALVTRERFFPYAAAKAGLVGLTRSLALDYGPRGVRVNCVCPGFTRTRLVEQSLDLEPDRDAAERAMADAVALRRIGAPEEVADAIEYLVSDRSSYVSGASLVVDGGLTARRAG